MKSLFWIAAAKHQLGNGYITFLALEELEKAFNGARSLIAVPTQSFPESLEEFIAGTFEIDHSEWIFWCWGLYGNRGGVYQLSPYDFKTDFQGVICVILNPPVIPSDFHGEVYQPIHLNEQRQYVEDTFDFFIWRGLPFKLPIFLLQIHDTPEPEPLNILLGDELFSKLPADLFYRTCSNSKLGNVPEMVRSFIQFLAEGDSS